MPLNNNIPEQKLLIAKRFAETPRTKFMDSRTAKSVKLCYYPQGLENASFDFLKATWSDDGRDSERTDPELIKKQIQDVYAGKSLPLAVELYDFVFLISGINRIDTHQIVRTRIGVTYSQQCSGDRDWRHHDCLVPPAVAKDKDILSKFKKQVIDAKMLYADMIDTEKVSLQDARYVLPHSLNTFIFWKINLVTFMELYRKRVCTMTQTWEYNQLVQMMADEVIKVMPQLANMFKADCDKGACFYCKAGIAHNTNLYFPDKKHDTFDYNEKSFFYKKTRSQMVEGPEFKTENYIGYIKQ